MKYCLFFLEYVGKCNDDTRQQLGSSIDGAAVGYWSGQMIHLSADGLILAIVPDKCDRNGDGSGYILVLKLAPLDREDSPSLSSSGQPTTPPLSNTIYQTITYTI